MDILSDIHKDYLAAGVSAMADDVLILGRPHGGVGIMWKKTMVDCVQFCKIPGTTRACACIVKNGTDELLYVNLYMPTDNQSKSVIDQCFIDTLDAFEMFFEKCHIRNAILAGDLNVDFSCKNAHDVYFKNFASRNDLICCCDMNIMNKSTHILIQ
jgi:exonuclease III